MDFFDPVVNILIRRTITDIRLKPARLCCYGAMIRHEPTFTMDGLYLVHAPEPLTFDNLENTRLYCYFSADLSELQRSFQSRATPGRAWSPPEPENFLTSKAKTLVVAAFSLWRGGEIKDAVRTCPPPSPPTDSDSIDYAFAPGAAI
jgi:hypothetical protein